MKKHLYRFFGCALILAAAVMSGHAANGIIETRNYKICPGDTVTIDTRKTVVYSDTILYDTILVTDPSLDSIYQYVVNVYPPFLNYQERTLERGTSFVWCDSTITKAGTYEKVYKTVESHCDSIYRLFVRERVETKLTQNLCKGSSISFGNQTISEGGVYRDTMHFSDYDSITILTLNVVKPDTVTQEIRIPQGQTWEWNGRTYDTDCVRDTICKNRFGCDSLSRLILTVYTVDTIDTVVTICPNTTFTWHGMTKGQTGVYEYQGVRDNGDLVMCRLDLTVKQLVYIDSLFTLCDEESVRFHGKTYVNAGEYYDAYTCDTTYRITIVKHPSQLFLQTGVLDRTNPYYWQYVLDGETKTDTIKEPGVYEHTTHNETTGCNDTYRLVLTKDETKYHYVEYVTICENEPYNWRDLKDLNKQGIGQTTHYFDRYRTVADQDSIYELILTVNPVPRASQTIPFCSSVEWNGEVIDKSTYRVDTFTSVRYQCDSIVTTYFTKGIPFHRHDTVTLTTGETFVWRNREITTTGLYEDKYTSSFGCDSIYSIGVGMIEPVAQIAIHRDRVEICQGDFYPWRNKNYRETGTFVDTLYKAVPADTEIDSLYILELTVHPVYEKTERVAFTSFPQNYNGHTFQKAGEIYRDSLHTIFGCDSIVVIYADQEVLRDEITETICPGKTFSWRGGEYNTTGRYVSIETGSQDQDSIEHILNLTVQYIPTTYVNKTICRGQSFTFGEETYTESGVYTQEMSENGCPYTAVLSLNVVNPDTIKYVHHMNEGEKYEWHKKTYYETTVEFFTTTNRFGCDSTEMLILTVNHVDTIDTIATVCPDEIPFIWHGITASQTGKYTNAEEQSDGSFNYYRLDLTVREMQYITKDFTVCGDENVSYNGKTYSAPGYYYDHLGCDTTVTIHVSRLPLEVHETHGSLGGEHGFTWTFWRNGEQIEDSTFYKPGTYEYESPNETTGCNDIWRLILIKDETKYHFKEELSICQGDDFTWHGFSNLSEIVGTNSYFVNYKTRTGQDSIYELVLEVRPIKRTEHTRYFCDQIDWNGTLYTESAVVYDTIALESGCYEIQRTNLDKARSFYSKEKKEIVQGDTIWWHGTMIYGDGTYYDRHFSQYGCDSIYELEVISIPAPPHTNMLIEQASICHGESYPWRGKEYSIEGRYVDTVHTSKKDSIYILNLTVWPSYKDTIIRHMYTCGPGASIRYQGKDYYKDTAIVNNLPTAHGCDSIVKVYMHFNTALYLSDTVKIPDTKMPYTWTYRLSGATRDTLLTTAGTYFHTEAAEGSCRNTEEIVLIVYPTYLYEDTITICETELPYHWTNGPTEHANDDLSHPVGTTRQYEYRYTTVNNTDSIYRLVLTIDKAPKDTIQKYLCYGDEFYINGHTYFHVESDTVYRERIVKPNPDNGCDSIIYYEIYQYPQKKLVETTILHPDDTIRWKGNVITSAATYDAIPDSIDTATGCLIIQQLRVIQDMRETKVICSNDTAKDEHEVSKYPYVWTHPSGHEPDTLYTTGLFYDTVYDAEGRIIEFHSLDLTISTPYDTVVHVHGCGQAGASWRDHVYYRDTAFVDRVEVTPYNPKAPCDSVFHVNIKIDTTYYFYYTDTICEHKLPYVVQGPGDQKDSIYTEGRTVHPFQTACGCDSIVEVRLTILPELKLYQDSVFLCEEAIREKPYILGDTLNPAFDLYRQKVNEWKGKWIGVQIENDSIVYNCDSTKSFHVIVRPHQAQPRDTTYYLCRGDSVQLFWPKEKWVKTDGIYLDTVDTRSAWVDGMHNMTHNDYAYVCDSVTRWTIIYADTIHEDTIVHIPMGDSLFWNNQYLYAEGTYDSIGQAPDTNSLGQYCKYVMTMHLFVDSTYYYRDTISVCEVPGKDTLYYWKDGYYQTYTMPDKDSAFHVIKPLKTLLYRFDSIYDMYIDYHRKYYQIIYDSICYGDSIQFDQHHFELENNHTIERYLQKAGQYIDTLRAASGCDSIIELRLFVRNRIDTTYQTATIIDRELPFVWENKWTDIKGIQHSHKDSMYVSGTYRDTLPSIYGCDSVFVLNLTVRPTYLYRDTVDTCEAINTTLTKYWPAADGVPAHKQEYTTPLHDNTLTYRDTVIINYPHDSVFYELYVNFHRTYQTHFFDTICAGDSTQIPTVLSIHPNTFYKTTGIYSDTVPSFFGCDSIITLHLQVWPNYPTTYIRKDIADVEAPYVWKHFNHAGDSIGVDSLYVPGDYGFRFETKFGCDSIDSLKLVIHKTYNIRLDTITICQSELPYTWEDITEIRKSDNYYFKTKTHDGYDSIRSVYINILPVLYETVRAHICEGDSMRFGLKKDGSPLFMYKDSVYRDTLTSRQYGCDSIVTLILNVRPRYFHDSIRHIADTQAPFVWKHFNHAGDSIGVDSLYVPGDYGYRFESEFSCDSIDSLHLFIHKTYDIRLDTITICQSEVPYTWEDITEIRKSDNYYFKTQTHDGYDSIRSVYINILPVLYDTIRAHICEGDSMRFGLKKDGSPLFLHREDVYRDTILSHQYGCDSIVTLFLNVRSKYISKYDAHIADIDTPYVWKHFNHAGDSIGVDSLYAAGKHGYRFASEFGCDSIDTLTLYIHHTYKFTEEITICERQTPYTWKDNNGITESGTYIYNPRTHDGYDSIFIATITVQPTAHQTITEKICKNDLPFNFHGKELTKGGIYIDTLASMASGCDSIVELHLTVNDPYYHFERRDIYAGDTCNFFGTPYTTSGTYTHSNTTPAGCDSVSELLLVVHPLVDTTAYVCSNDLPFEWVNHWNGSTTLLHAAGIYHNDTTYVNGERTFWSIELIVKEPVVRVINENICEGENNFFSFNGQKLTTSGIYKDTLQTADGCDSIVELHLTVNKPYYNYIERHIIQGQSVEVLGHTFDKDTIHTIKELTADKCDSIIDIKVIVHPLIDTTVIVCSTDLPYIWTNKWNGQVTPLYAAGIYRNDTTIVNGKQMYYGLRLIVNEPTSTILYRSICKGGQYDFNGQMLSTSGEYRDTLRNAAGCDSIVVLHLNVEPTYYHTIERTIYEGDTVMFEGQPYSTAGIYPIRYTTTTTNCDSIIELRLNVNRLYDDSVTVCANELPLTWRNKTIYESGIYRDTMVNTEGKETTIGLKVNVLPILRAPEPINKTICEGDFYKFGKNVLSEQGTYYDTLTAMNGCDSIVMLALTVIPAKYETMTKRIFEGDSVEFNNAWYKESGVYEYRVTNNNGCTDTYQLILTVLKTFNVDTAAVICDSDLPFIWRGIEYNETGDYVMPIAWTDSSRVVKTLHLTVNKSFYGERNISICAGDTFLFKGKQYYQNGTFNDTIPSATGCDSIIKYIVAVHPTLDFTIEKHISDKEPFLFHDRVLTISGTYEWTGKTVHGCDSMEHLFLTVHPSYFRSDTFDLCQSDSVNFPFQWKDEKGKLIMEISQSGTYTDSILTEYGFDSVRQAVVHVHPSFFINEQYEIGVGEHLKIHGRDISSPAIYFDTLRTIHGCDSIFHVVVNQKRTREWTWDREICQGEYFDFFGRKLTHTGQYKYTSQYKDSVITLNLTVNPISITETRKVITDKQVPYIYNGRIYEQGGIYNDTLVNKFGCDSILRFVLIISSRYSEWTPMPLCAGSEIKIDGQVITEAGLYTFLRRSRVTGEMDSIWRVEVYDAPAYEFDVNTTLCDGDTLFFGDKAITRGGKQDVVLKTTDGCDSIFHLDITLFPSYTFDTTITIFDYQTYTWEQNHQTYNVAGQYTKTFPTIHDCDSTYVLNLQVIQTIRQSTEYTICEGQEYTWRGKKYSIEGYYTDTVNDAATYMSGIYTLHLIVAHPTYIANATGGEICADDKDFQIAFTYTGAKPTFYSIYYDQAAKDEGFIDVIDQPFLGEDRYATGSVPAKPEVLYLNHTNYVKPGTYTMSLVLDNGVCGVSRADNIELVVKYPSWIIEQNWNDVVVPLKKELNGGYEFNQVEWFVNGVRQMNNGKGYLEHNFHDGDEVVMSATRKGENRAYETCPLVITINSSIAYEDPILVYPTQAPRHTPRVCVEAPREGSYEVIATTGLIVAQGNLNEGQTQITLPAISGIYFIRVHQGDNVTSHKVMIY